MWGVLVAAVGRITRRNPGVRAEQLPAPAVQTLTILPSPRSRSRSTWLQLPPQLLVVIVTGNGRGLPFQYHTLVIRDLHMTSRSILEVLAGSSTLIGMRNTVNTFRMIYKCLLVSDLHEAESRP